MSTAKTLRVHFEAFGEPAFPRNLRELKEQLNKLGRRSLRSEPDPPCVGDLWCIGAVHIEIVEVGKTATRWQAFFGEPKLQLSSSIAWGYRANSHPARYCGRVLRLWGLPPAIMCRRHLLQEHQDLHQFASRLKRGKNCDLFFYLRCVDTSLIKERHTQLKKEMKRRGFEHSSPMSFTSTEARGSIDVLRNAKDLLNRCPKCRYRYETL